MGLCSEVYHTVRGIVVDGIGEGAKYIRVYLDVIKETLGLEPYPGTLNVRLSNEAIEEVREYLTKTKPPRIIPPPAKDLGRVFSWGGYIRFDKQCTFVYVLKPEKSVYGYDVLEIISDKYLRKGMGIRSGDEIEIIFTQNDVTPCICL